jgi:hypothetical protein
MMPPTVMAFAPAMIKFAMLLFLSFVIYLVMVTWLPHR